MMTPEEEAAHIYDVLKSLTADINALTDELQPYMLNKRTLEDELRQIEFVNGKKSVVQSVKFCGVSHIACDHWLEACGWVLERNHHYNTVERTVLERNRRGVADRRIIFGELLDLAEEWGPRMNQLRDLKADRTALNRRLEALEAIMKRAARKKRSRPEPPPTGQESLF